MSKRVSLECPCGLPLQVEKLEGGKWAIGHFDRACSYMVWEDGDSLSDAEKLGKIMVQLLSAIEDGSFIPKARSRHEGNPKVSFRHRKSPYRFLTQVLGDTNEEAEALLRKKEVKG